MVPASGQRIATLDIVRGVAVMGILVMNIVGFGLPATAYFNPHVQGSLDGLDLGLWAAAFVLVDGKMRGLFALLFGASMLLMIDRAEAAGGNPVRIHLRRMGWLLVIGLMHLYLVWWGDILSHYALVGLLAYPFRCLPPRLLVTIGLGLIAVETVLMASTVLDAFASHAAAQGPGASPRAIAQWAAYENTFGTPAPEAIAAELAAYRGDYATVLAYRWETDWHTPVSALIYVGPETLAYMLFGMAALRSGLLTGDWTPARYRRWALVGLGTGAAVNAALAALAFAHDFDPRYTSLSTLMLATPARPAMVLGWAALILLVARAGRPLVGRIAAVGRMALSNYVGTSLVCTTLFYGYGFGLFGTLGRAGLLLVMLAVWAAMLAWSRPWLDRFAYGPLEWVWRCLTRMQIQPIRRTQDIATYSQHR